MMNVMLRWSCWLLVSGVLVGQQAASLVERAARIVPMLQAKMAADGIPGLSCAVVVGDELIWSTGCGLADVENDVPASDATVYRLASISKPVTAVLAMQLVERGELDLDADASTIVAAFAAKRWPVTTRQLLGHLGGVRHYRPGENESTVHYARQLDALPRFAADALLHEPGTRYQYSTYGFNLIAAVVETRTGKPFGEVVRERIAEPSGASSLQDDDVRRIIKGRAAGYVRRRGELQNSELMDGSYKLGGGGLCCSARDLVRFAQALMAGKLLRPETLATMWTEQQTTAGKPTGYGLGFGVRQEAGHRVISHSGAQSRVSTMLYMLPDERVAVVLLCNLERVRLGGLAKDIAFCMLADGGKK